MARAEPRLSYENVLQILELSRQFAATSTLADMLDTVLSAATRILDADSGSIWLYDETRDRLRMRIPQTAQPIETKTCRQVE